MQADPDNAELRDRAAADDGGRVAGAPRAREGVREAGDQLEAALGEYRLGSEYDPSNRTVDRQGGRARADHSRSHRGVAPPAGDRSAAGAGTCRSRRTGAEPCVARPVDAASSRTPRSATCSNFIANATGINITYDRDVADGRPISVQLDGVTLEQALNQIMTMAQLSYKVINEQSIFVFPDTTAEAPALRRTGHSHVLHLERRSDRAVADAEPAHSDSPASPCSR